MLGLESLGPAGQAIQNVGAVLLEAMILYVVYGALTTAVTGKLKQVLGGN